ncbi:MAG: DNA cytosine methyltransferase [Anaerolineae bacterium]|nr:DNA cytosine methyltransferase [Anaerolineae bacterium]
MTFGSYFSGFGGVDIGAKQAGLQLVFAVEYDPTLAAVYRQNLGDHVMIADVCKLDVSALPYVDVFHASPPCTNASVANAKAGESPLDIAMAQAVCRYIVAKRPAIFTLENVYMYRKFESWRIIARALLDNGYSYGYWHVNMADYGVPQTRKRMIVIARRDGKTPMLPEATHAEEPQAGFFGTRKRWVSWYEAIEDAHAQKTPYTNSTKATAALEHVKGTALCGVNNTRNCDQPLTVRWQNEPAFSLRAGRSGAALIKDNGVFYSVSNRQYARLQSFPDWYQLPTGAVLTAKGVGNAVPPLFAQKLYEEVI